MDSQDFDATLTPTDIVAALSLEQDTLYTVQNVDNRCTLRFRQGATAPVAHGRAHRVEIGSYVTIRPRGTPIWFWTDEQRGCDVIVTPAV